MRVLIVRTGAMGDVLHAMPAVAALRHARPEWQIDWAVSPRWSSLLVDEQGCGPLVQRVHLADTKLWSAVPLSLKTLRSVLALRAELRSQRYDVAVDMQGTLRSAVITRMSGAGSVCGYADPREATARWCYTSTSLRQGTHVVQQGAALLGEACGVPLNPATPEIARTASVETWATELAGTHRLCVLAPGAGWAAKQWPAERFAELAKKLRAMGFACVVNASQPDDPLAGQVAALSGGATSVVVCNVTELIALVRRAALLVGGDSGPMHLAAMLGVPVVALFGPTDPERNGPWGPGPKSLLRDAASVTSYKRTSAPDAGLANITEDDVLATVRAMI